MKNKLLVILGATSTGKTDLALNFAKKLKGEIISADSRQVYKYLDIGTGKLPGSDVKVKKSDGYWEMDGIKVNLYDAALPKFRFNLYEYITEAQNDLAGIREAEKFPIIVGGTGLYIRSLLEGVSDFGTEEDTDLREQLEDLNAGEIANKIQLLSPQTYKKLNESEIKNKRRLIRIFEKLNGPYEAPRTYARGFFSASQLKLFRLKHSSSDLHLRFSALADKSLRKFNGIEEFYDVLKIGLTTDIKILREKIKNRLVLRINQGMIEESKKLLEGGILTFERMEELGLEYRYIAKYIKGEIKTEEELIGILAVKIGQYAKRQETWFNKEKGVIWFDIADPETAQKLESKVLNWYNMRSE